MLIKKIEKPGHQPNPRGTPYTALTGDPNLIPRVSLLPDPQSERGKMARTPGHAHKAGFWYVWGFLQNCILLPGGSSQLGNFCNAHARFRRGGLMVSALDFGSSGPGSSPGPGHCVVFLGKTHYSLFSQCFSPPRSVNGYGTT